MLGLVSKVCFLAFFILNGWNQFTDLKASSAEFSRHYRTFEKTWVNRFGLPLPEFLSWRVVNSNAATITQALSLGQILFAFLAMMGMPAAFIVVSALYFLQQAIHLNLASFSFSSSMPELERLAFSVAILTAGIGYYMHCPEAKIGVFEKASRLIHGEDVK